MYGLLCKTLETLWRCIREARKVRLLTGPPNNEPRARPGFRIDTFLGNIHIEYDLLGDTVVEWLENDGAATVQHRSGRSGRVKERIELIAE
jgi:hypothetical protein